MPLVDEPLPLDDAPIPARVAALVADGEARIAAFGRALPAFIPSDHLLVYRALRSLRDGGVLTGTRFCEWGSGLGIVAGLAALCGYEAHAIEIEADLVAEGEALSAAHGLLVEHVAATFVPVGSEDLTAAAGDELEWLQPGGADAYELFGRDPDEFDLFFAYPWPGEEEIVFSIFERHAGRGALLLSYHGIEGLRAQRAISR